MVFGGLQKLTLLDFPGRVACTVFTKGCNFRCPFCHNASLVVSCSDCPDITEEEILTFLKKRQGILDGVCITGGEPLLHPEIETFIKKVKELGYAIKLDTNGSRPGILKKLVEQKLVDKVAMDIKNSKAKYALTAGDENLDLAPIIESVDFLLSGSVDYEFRTTVTKDFHSARDFEEIGLWIQGANAYFLQGFVDSGNLINPDVTGVDSDIIHEYLAVVRKYVNNAEIRGIE